MDEVQTTIRSNGRKLVSNQEAPSWMLCTVRTLTGTQLPHLTLNRNIGVQHNPIQQSSQPFASLSPHENQTAPQQRHDTYKNQDKVQQYW